MRAVGARSAEVLCTSGPVARTRWAPPSTAGAPTSRSSPRSRSGSSCACSTTTGSETRVDAARAQRARLARLPAPGRARASGTATGCTAPTTRRRACAATRRSCCSTRTRRRSTGTSSGTRRCSPTGSATRTARNDADSAPYAMTSVVINPFFDWAGDRPLRIPYNETVIYEAHVKGMTMRHPDIPEDVRGTLRGPGAPGDDPTTCSELGVTAVELMPVHQFVHDSTLVERGLSNYWGYNTIGFFAPHNDYACFGTRGEQVLEFKTMVRALHRAGHRGDPRRRLQPHRRGQPPGPDAVVPRHRQPGLLPARPRRPAALLRHHRHRQQPQRPPPRVAAADHGLAAVLGHRDARRRVPVRPRLRAGPGVPRGRPARGVLRPGQPGPGRQPGQADRRAVGRRRGRLPGRRLPPAVDGVERPLPRHRARLLARRAGEPRRVRARGSPAARTCTRPTAAGPSRRSTS